MTDSLSPTSGAIVAGLHRLPLRIYYEDTDAGGIVYHSQYLNFMERGRTEMLRLCGFEHSAMMTTQTSPTLLVVKSMNIDFARPATIDDEIVVETRISKLGAASMMMQQVVKSADEVLITAEVKVGVLGADKRPKKMSQEMRNSITKAIE